ncbi:MAG: winged helix-turn-helix domain-containing protein [Pseudoxanthomonas sp.]
MLKPRTDPLHARSERLQVGDFVVDITRREVVSPAQAVTRLTIKAQHVLLSLAWEPGKVVSREALLQWVWPDTMPTDDVLTQAIGQLRKAFHDSRDTPRYVETIAKGGYRLLAPVQWLPDADDALAATMPTAQAAQGNADAPPLHASPARKRWQWAALATLAALGGVIGTWHLLRPAPAPEITPVKPPTSLDFRIITSRPGIETHPALSPDGSTVAYVQVDDLGRGTIMQQATLHVPPRALVTPPPGDSDIMPVWSHDGRRLAFVRYGADDACRIMSVASSGGEAQRLADCPEGGAFAFDWTPAGDGLLMGNLVKQAGASNSRLRRFDFASGQWRTLDYEIADDDIDSDPKYSPDGQWIVFRRNLSLADLWRMPAGGGKPERLTNVRGDIRGWDWLPDGSGLLFCLSGQGMSVFRYDIANARLDSIAMGAAVVNLDVARQSPSMAFTVDKGAAGIFRFDLPATPGGKAARSRVFASSGSELLPSLSPDGHTLAFLSDRGGRMELWLGQTDAPDNVRAVADFTPVPRHDPVWSADSCRLLVIGSERKQQGLYEVDAESARARRLPVPVETPTYAAWVDKPDRLLVGSDSGEGRLQASLFDTSTQPWRVLASLQDVALVRFDRRDGAVYFTRMGEAGTWRTDASLAATRPIDTTRPRHAGEYKRWTLGTDGPWFVDASEQCSTGWIRLGAPQSASPLCLQHEGGAWPAAPSMDASGKAIYLTMTTASNTDIGWADVSALLSGSGP